MFFAFHCGKNLVGNTRLFHTSYGFHGQSICGRRRQAPSRPYRHPCHLPIRNRDGKIFAKMRIVHFREDFLTQRGAEGAEKGAPKGFTGWGVHSEKRFSSSIMLIRFILSECLSCSARSAPLREICHFHEDFLTQRRRGRREDSGGGEKVLTGFTGFRGH